MTEEAVVTVEAVTVETAAAVTHAPRAKAKQKTPQQKTVLEEVFASTSLQLPCAAGFRLRVVLTGFEA